MDLITRAAVGMEEEDTSGVERQAGTGSDLRRRKRDMQTRVPAKMTRPYN